MGKVCAKKNYSSAMELFENDVVSFGTWMDIVQGLDQLKIKSMGKYLANYK